MIKHEIIPAWFNLLPEQVRIKGTIGEKNTYVFLDDEYLNPYIAQKINNHSPTGFGWGYGGSGPAQLALAILLEYLPIKTSLKYYQLFKWECIAQLPPDDFEQTINLREVFYSLLMYGNTEAV